MSLGLTAVETIQYLYSKHRCFTGSSIYRATNAQKNMYYGCRRWIRSHLVHRKINIFD